MSDRARQIADLVAAGDKLQAIKLLREATGMSLVDAKNAIEAAATGAPLPWPPTPASGSATAAPGLPLPVRQAAERGNRIEAIKLLRAHTGLGLKEAKDRLDHELPPAATPGARRGCLLPMFCLLATGIAFGLTRG